MPWFSSKKKEKEKKKIKNDGLPENVDPLVLRIYYAWLVYQQERERTLPDLPLNAIPRPQVYEHIDQDYHQPPKLTYF